MPSFSNAPDGDNAQSSTAPSRSLSQAGKSNKYDDDPVSSCAIEIERQLTRVDGWVPTAPTLLNEDVQTGRCALVVKVERMLKELKGNIHALPVFLFCVLTQRRNCDIYGPWRKKKLHEMGFVPSNKMNGLYFTNVLLKINDKEGQAEEEDRLSALPDEILLIILERLSVHSVIQASTLSRRWRDPPLMLTRLVFHINDFMQRSAARTVGEVMASYCEATKKLLASASAIKDPRLIFYLADSSHLHSIGQAVGNAVQSGNIGFLELSIWPEIRGSICTDEHLMSFGRRFMSFLDACSNTFRWLKSIILRGEAEMPTILNTCHKLQVLTLHSCQLSQLDSVLKIDAPSSQPMALKFIRCYFAHVELVCLPHLVSLVYDTWLSVDPAVRFGCVPRLHSIRVASPLLFRQIPFTLSGRLSNARNLTILHLDFHDEMVWFQPEHPKKLVPVFSNLKVVYLYNSFADCELKWTLLFLEAVPSLDSFYVKHVRSRCWPPIPRYMASIPAQFPKVERINYVFKQLGDGSDDAIINRRDGVSGSQLSQVLSAKLNQVIKAYHNMVQRELSMINIDQRNYHMEILQADAPDNVPSGFVFREISSVRASANKFASFYFSSDRKLLATGGHAKKGGSRHLRFQPRLGGHLAAASENDVKPQACVRRFEGHTKGSLCWDSYGNVLYLYLLVRRTQSSLLSCVAVHGTNLCLGLGTLVCLLL